MIKILVTGGKGFIGSHLVDYLVLDNNNKVFSIDRTKIEETYRNKRCNYLVADLSRIEDLDKLFSLYKFNFIYHLAGNSNVPMSHQSPFYDFESNALGTLNIYQLGIKHKVTKVLFTSSAAVYGAPKLIPVKEDHVLNPISNYALTKLYGEKLAIAYNETYDIKSSVIRIFNTYGPKQKKYVIYDLLKKISLNKERIELLGNADTVRDYCFIDDTVVAFTKVMNSSKTDGEVFNLAGGSPITILELIQTICRILNINPILSFSGETWKGDIKVFNADICKMKKYVGFQPKVNLELGLRKTIVWFRNNGLNL